MFDSDIRDVQYSSLDNHQAIVNKETFEAVQDEKERRSNVVKEDGEMKRKSKKYRSKKVE